MLETRDPSAAALHEVENVVAKLFIGGVEGKHVRDVIVLLQPPEAGAGPVARAQRGEQFRSDDIEAGIVVFGEDGEQRYESAIQAVGVGGRREHGRSVLREYS